MLLRSARAKSCCCCCGRDDSREQTHFLIEGGSPQFVYIRCVIMSCNFPTWRRQERKPKIPNNIDRIVFIFFQKPWTADNWTPYFFLVDRNVLAQFLTFFFCLAATTTRFKVRELFHFYFSFFIIPCMSRAVGPRWSWWAFLISLSNQVHLKKKRKKGTRRKKIHNYSWPAQLAKFNGRDNDFSSALSTTPN